MHAEHRTWFPYILIGLSALLALVIAAWFRPSDQVTESPPTTQETVQELPPMVTEEEYRVLVNSILQQYAESGDANAAYQELLDIVIPPAYKDLHLELVIVLGKFDAGKAEEAQARYDLLTQQYDWLAL